MYTLLKLQSNTPLRFPWTTKDVMVLKRLYQKGTPRHKIAQRLRRSPDSVQKALLRFEVRKKRVVNHNQRLCPLCYGKRYVPVNGNERKEVIV